jgi:MarR family transcriptional regulator, organic hydroperoxide resistance regulator
MDAARLYECFIEYMPFYFRYINPILHSFDGDGVTLNENQIKVLLATDFHRSIPPAELSRIFMIPKSSLTTIIRSLVDAGLLIREVNPRNERNYSLDLTPFGQKIVSLMKERHEEKFVRLFSSFPEEELELSIRGLSLISEYLKREEERNGQ